jgi:hypothetical protein
MKVATGAGMQCQLDERARQPLFGCMQSLGRDRVYMGDSRWDAMLGCRRRQSLGLWMDKTECRPFFLFGCGQLLGCDREMCGS